MKKIFCVLHPTRPHRNKFLIMFLFLFLLFKQVRLLVDWEMDPSALTHPWRGINSSRVCQDVLPVEIIFDIMVRETNRYADQYFQGKGGVGITFVLYMGMVKLPTCPIQYWSSHRFLNIMIFLLLHCADNSAPPPWNSSQYDRLHKVTEVVDTYSHRCLAELLLPETGIPRIPIRWGMKIWSLIDSRSGYVYNWNINRGKKDGLRTQNNDGKETVHWTTWDLLEPANMLDKSYHLFFFLKLYLKMWPQGIQELAIHCE